MTMRPASVLPKLLALPLFGLSLLPGLSAQEREIVDPAPFEWATVRRETGFPFGYATRRVLRYQEVHDGLAGRPTTVSAVAFRRSPDSTDLVPAFTADVAMRLSTATVEAAAIASSFAANRGADVVDALPRRTVSFPASGGPYEGPAPFDYVVPADRPFAFAGTGPLCVELTVFDHGNRSDARFALHAAGDAYVTDFGEGCGGTTQDTVLIAPEAVHSFAGLPPNAPLVILLGTRLDTLADGTPLPFDLEPLGAPGCTLGVRPLLDVRGLADAAGAFEARVPVDGLPPGFFYAAQAVAVQPGVNELGALTTDVDVVLPESGRVVGRVWTEDLAATTGLRQPVFGLVLQVR